jgi:N-methylhydantoinase A/oxoprolinase/acetone carboxylase beta subunit
MQSLRLGIDTGGTYTDAVLLNDADQVEASAKVLTNHQDLVSSIRNVLDTLPQLRLRDTRLVSLSTTLGTNAVVEGRGTPACLLLAGYNETQVRRARLHDLVAGGHCVLLAGAHDAAGNETEPLDLAAAEKMVRRHRDQVTAFGISGMFSVRNPAHEIALRELVLLETDLPVTCGHELADALDAPRRAVTVAFNATLVSYIDRLIRSTDTE